MYGFGITDMTAPELKSVMEEEVLKFNLAYHAYLTKFDEFNNSRVQSQRIPPALIKSCVLPVVLDSMVLRHAFPGISDIQHVTDSLVNDWVEIRCHVPINEMQKPVSDAHRRVCFIPNSSDPEGAAFRFFILITTEFVRYLLRPLRLLFDS